MLELTAVSESVIMDNLKTFEMNGFKFDIDSEGMAQPPTLWLQWSPVGSPVTSKFRRSLSVSDKPYPSFFVFPSLVAPPMKRVRLTAKPVSKNWSMEKQGGLGLGLRAGGKG